MRKYAAALILFILASVMSSAEPPAQQGQEDRAKLQHEISVTANRIKTPARETASSVTVITREDLERTRKETVLEALQDSLGLALTQNGPMGGAASVMIRGANSEHTLILLDGVELNDPISPARSSDLAHLTIEAVDRIEILRGPQSLLYGSDALGGVINIITQKGRGKPRFQMSTMAGSLATVSGRALIRGGGRKGFFTLGTSYHQTTGISAAAEDYPGNREKDGYRNLSLTGNMGYTPADNLEFSLLFRYTANRSEIDNSGGPYGDDPNHVQHVHSLLVKGQARASLLNNRWEQILALAAVTSDRKSQNPVDAAHPYDAESGQYSSRLWKVDWQHNLYLHRSNTLMLGLDLQKEEGKSEYLWESRWGPFSSLFPQKSAESLGFYIQDQIRLAGRFSATAGIRMNHHPSFGTIFTYRIAPALFIQESGTKIKASLGTGFKAPSLYQRYAPETAWGRIGNENLRPEESIGWDVGAEQLFFSGNLSAGITYFRNRFENLIQFDYSLGYTNIGLSRAHGVEMDLLARPAPGVSFRSGFTHTVSRDLQSGEALLRRPQDKLTCSADLRLGKALLNLSLNHTGRRYDMDYFSVPSQRVRLTPYTLLGARLSWEISPAIKIFLRLDNILDTHYELVKGYGAPGFQIFAGLTLK